MTRPLRLAALLLPLFTTLACTETDPTGGVGGGGSGGQGGTGGAGGEGASGGTGGAPITTRIAFGSCMHQNDPKPVLELATASEPDLFIFLGDNIYGDTLDPSVLQAKYDLLGSSSEYQNLRANVPIIATWDDHDFGQNDAGKENPIKSESKDILLTFFDEPAESPRWTREGLYTSYLYDQPGAGVLQVILLDTRWFRDPLDDTTDFVNYKNDYQPTPDTTRTFLGEDQWAWLEEELKKPADVRILGTSIQFGHSYNGWESWNNMPHERQRMIDLIKSTGAESLVFISGDVHWGELSKVTAPGVYPLYDMTSSGITETWFDIDDNDNRIGEAEAKNNYGFIEIQWGETDHTLTLGLINKDGDTSISQKLSTSELRF
ncbi:MAG: alkaline phosphatase D family protein [Polyangiaceae bacterium]